MNPVRLAIVALLVLPLVACGTSSSEHGTPTLTPISVPPSSGAGITPDSANAAAACDDWRLLQADSYQTTDVSLADLLQEAAASHNGQLLAAMTAYASPGGSRVTANRSALNQLCRNFPSLS